jgi:hypothetical protein
VEPLAATEPVDGIICGPKGNIYLSCLEENAIKRYVRGGMNRTSQRIRASPGRTPSHGDRTVTST